jgi:hypothetical protein
MLLLAGSLAFACSHRNDRPPASSETVERATSTPSTGPDFTPPQNQPDTDNGVPNGAGTLTGNGSSGTSGPGGSSTPADASPSGTNTSGSASGAGTPGGSTSSGSGSKGSGGR